jgi:hypothetical protein
MLEHVGGIDSVRRTIGNRQALHDVAEDDIGWKSLRVLSDEPASQRKPLDPQGERRIEIQPALRRAMPAAILDVGHAQKPFPRETVLQEAHGLLHGRNCRKQSVSSIFGVCGVLNGNQ